MLIFTEKPNVAKDFAVALKCEKHEGYYSNSNTVITNAKGHLFVLEEPNFYSQGNFPVIPEKYEYRENPKTIKQSKIAVKLLKEHKNDAILIATDADREGEVIARICLMKAGITDLKNIRRFWVSQALTTPVIIEGIKNSKPLSTYNTLALNGFARQHADWLCGMNFSRYISYNTKAKLSVGRVQTAILSAIVKRCETIKNFKSEKYFEHYGLFREENTNKECRGIYFENDKTSFENSSKEEILKKLCGKKAVLKDSKNEEKKILPPELYNLNACQKDAFKFFGYTAKETLEIIQSLYDELKCVSYPRTPSRVMGSENVELCKNIFKKLTEKYPRYNIIKDDMNISLSNTRCFNDKKLEAHHALIPLDVISDKANEKQKNVYNLILERFMIAFLPEYKYIKHTYILSVDEKTFKITGNKTIENGFKKHSAVFNYIGKEKNENNEEEQNLDNINFNNLFLSSIETKEKWTKPPKFFNEASILSFMENPKFEKQDENNTKKLIGLGTPATRHSFIPILLNRGYITVQNKNFISTKLGESLIHLIEKSSLKPLSNISNTTEWEEKLEENPLQFEKDIKIFVKNACSEKLDTENSGIKQGIEEKNNTGILCPLCKKPMKENSKSYFCSGYFDKSCSFQLWKTTSGAKFSKTDIKNLCDGKTTQKKKCKSAQRKEYECRFTLNTKENWTLERIYD